MNNRERRAKLLPQVMCSKTVFEHIRHGKDLRLQFRCLLSMTALGHQLLSLRLFFICTLAMVLPTEIATDSSDSFTARFPWHCKNSTRKSGPPNIECVFPVPVGTYSNKQFFQKALHSFVAWHGIQITGEAVHTTENDKVHCIHCTIHNYTYELSHCIYQFYNFDVVLRVEFSFFSNRKGMMFLTFRNRISKSRDRMVSPEHHPRMT